MEENERVKDREEKQELWSWGAGTDGQLGTGKLQDEHLPQLIPVVLPSLSLLSCGGAHVIAVTHGKKVLTWGRGTSGQLGHGDLVNSLEPKSVEALNNFNITHVSAGWNHSGFVSECGRLFTCGDGSFGQLGLGDYVSQSSPIEVSHFASGHVYQVACGMRHSLALLKGEHGDRVYGFGSGKRGQLGISKEKVKSVSLPQSVCGLQEVNVSSISANGDHSAALSSDGHLYTWGRGFGGTPDVCCPNRVISQYSFKQAALGWNHALVLTDEGEVLMLGGSHHGVLSNPQKDISVNQDLNEGQIKKIPSLNRIKVVGVASGSEHSVVTTGKHFGWQNGRVRSCGLDNGTDGFRSKPSTFKCRLKWVGLKTYLYSSKRSLKMNAVNMIMKAMTLCYSNIHLSSMNETVYKFICIENTPQATFKLIDPFSSF